MMIEMFQHPIFLDTETTGIADCRLVELAWSLPAQAGDPSGRILTVRAKPPIPISEEAIAIHGITNEEVANLSLFSQNIQYDKIKKLLEENVVIAHNAPFDIGVLAREGIVVRNFIDTLAVAKKLYPRLPRHNLQFLREHFHIETEGKAHSAKGDVVVLMALYERMKQDV